MKRFFGKLKHIYICCLTCIGSCDYAIYIKEHIRQDCIDKNVIKLYETSKMAKTFIIYLLHSNEVILTICICMHTIKTCFIECCYNRWKLSISCLYFSCETYVQWPISIFFAFNEWLENETFMYLIRFEEKLFTHSDQK